jgi:chorismate mutase
MVDTPPKLAAVEPIEQIEDLRRSIDNLDNALIAILAERFRLTEKVGKLKAAGGFEALDAERERSQLERFRQLATAYGLDMDVVRDVMTKIFQHVKSRHQVLLRGG